MKQSPKQPAEKRRAQLVKAAMKVFMKKGYAGATTAEIAKTANLTKGSLYFHFKNKEDIFFAVIKERSQNWADSFNEFIEKEKKPEIFIEKIIRKAFSMIEAHKYFSIDLWQRAHKIPKIRNYMAEEHRQFETKIINYLTSHSNLKRKECKTFFGLLHAMIDGIMIRQMICCEDKDINSFKENIIVLSKLYLNKDKLLMG